MRLNGKLATSRFSDFPNQCRNISRLAVSFSLAFANLFWCSPVLSQAEPTVPQIAPQDSASFYDKLDQLNHQILQKDIEGERFNINFRRAVNVQGRWRGPRYFLSQETNAAGTAAGLWLAVHARYQAINHKYLFALDKKGKLLEKRNTPNRILLEHAIIPQLVGQCVGGYGSAFEYGINLYHDHQARKKGLDFDSAVQHVSSLKTEVESLFKERQALIDQYRDKIPASHVQMAEAQGQVLKDLCYLALSEYLTFHYNSRRYRTFQDSIYLMDVTRNAFGAAGNIVALYGTAHRRPSCNLPAGLGTLISGAIVVVAPASARLIGKLVADHEANSLSYLRKTAERSDVQALEKDHLKLKQLVETVHADDPLSHRFLTQLEQLEVLNELNIEEHRNTFHLSNRELRAQTRAAQENIVTGAIVGGTKTALGIGASTAGLLYYNHPETSNALIAGTTIVYAVGATIGAAENVRIQLSGELQRRKLARQHLLPGQILSEHMNKLDQIQRELDKSGGNNR